MKFERANLFCEETGTNCKIYMPVDKETPPQPVSSVLSAFAKLEVDGTSRLLALRLLEMMDTFNSNPMQRAALGHDSAVFALACTTGEPYEDIDFNESRHNVGLGPLMVEASSDGDFMVEPDIPAGGIAFTANAFPHDSRMSSLNAGLHLMVRATPPQLNQEPLYLSMLAIGGPVALHGLTDVVGLYPAITAGYVAEIDLVTE